MFFIFGFTTKAIGTKEIALGCPACSQQALFLVGLQNFFHLFWIPVIPLGKYSVVACGACGSEYPRESLKFNLNPEEEKFKTPWWGFWFLYFLAAFAVFVVISLLIS